MRLKSLTILCCLAITGLFVGGLDHAVAEESEPQVLTVEQRVERAKLWDAAARAALAAGRVHSQWSVPLDDGRAALVAFKGSIVIPGARTKEEQALLDAAQQFADQIWQPIHGGVKGAGAGSFERHATAFFRHALVLNPEDAEATQGLVDTADSLVRAAETYRVRPDYYGGPRIAVWLYQQALENDPDNAGAKAELARIPALLVQRARAAVANHWDSEKLEMLRAAAELDPDDPEVVRARKELPALLIASAQRDIDAGNLQYTGSAQDKLEDVLALDPENLQAKQMLRTVADHIAGMGDWNLARAMIDGDGEPVRYYQDALAIDPENARAKRGLLALPMLQEARRALKNGDITEGGAMIEKIAAIDPEMPGLNTLREMAAQSGN
ncbi:tetratricopeptide repeat protein [Dongia sp. agr-C8]